MRQAIGRNARNEFQHHVQELGMNDVTAHVTTAMHWGVLGGGTERESNSKNVNNKNPWFSIRLHKVLQKIY